MIGDEDNFDKLIIYFKDNKKKEKIINIHGMQNRETLVTLADNYIEVNKKILDKSSLWIKPKSPR